MGVMINGPSDVDIDVDVGIGSSGDCVGDVAEGGDGASLGAEGC